MAGSRKNQIFQALEYGTGFRGQSLQDQLLISEQVSLEVAEAPNCPRPRRMTWEQPCPTSTPGPLPCLALSSLGTLRTQGAPFTLLDSPSLQQREGNLVSVPSS